MNDADLPAMPFVESNGYVATGLSKREYFAGLAMQGLINDDANMRNTEVARRAVLTADALLAELTREPT
jgi:hypothetical protein